MSLIYAQALEESVSDSSARDSAPALSVRSTNDASTSYELDGRAYPSTETCVIVMGFPCQNLSVGGKREGLSGSQSSLIFDILGLLPRTSSTPGAGGCPSCGAISDSSGM